MKLLAPALLLILSASTAQAQQDGIDPNWDVADRVIWRKFSRTPHMIDTCALKIAHEVAIDPRTDWPAYCNRFKDTAAVQDRVAEIKTQLANLKLSRGQREQLANGQISVGATGKMAELSWGRPEKVNRTITSEKVSEQWVYPSGNYLYVTDGRVSAIQN